MDKNEILKRAQDYIIQKKKRMRLSRSIKVDSKTFENYKLYAIHFHKRYGMVDYNDLVLYY